MPGFGQMRRVARRTSRRTSRRMNAMNEPQAPEQEEAVEPAEDSTTAQLEDLAKLKNEGVITEEEFAAKKKQILGL